MGKVKSLSVVFGVLALVFLAYPLFSQENADRSAQPAALQIVPPIDPIPPNLEPPDLSDQEKKLQDMAQYPGNSFENRYRGVVAGNFDSSDASDELVVDFGANGVWVRDYVFSSGAWHQITGVNPSWIFSVRWGPSTDEEIIGDFGSYGLWMWNYNGYPGDWLQLSGVNPEQGLAVDDDGDGKEEIQVDFGTLGLWRYDYDNSTWYQLSTLNALLGGVRNDFWSTGWQEGVWGFSGYGVWSFYASTSGTIFINQLSGNTPSYPNVSAEFGIADDSNELIMSFGNTLGLWLAEESDIAPYVSWNKISGEDPIGLKEVKFVGNPDYELLVDFWDVVGFWWWNYSGYPGTWTKLSDNDPGDGFFEPFDPNGYDDETTGDEEVAVDFDSLGLHLYDYTTGAFTQLSASNPVYMVRTDLYGSNINEGIVVDFGTSGLWVYNGYTNQWWQISGLSPD